MKLLTLGPKGTFSHQAAELVDEAEIVFASAIPDIFSLLHQRVMQYALVPIENSVSGTIYQTLDGLLEGDFKIQAEIVLPIKHHLVSFTSLDKIRRLYVHPHSYEQCRGSLMKISLKEGHLEDADILYTTSNAMSAKSVLEHRSDSAALLSEYGAKLYEIPILRQEMQDAKNNETRFILLGPGSTDPTGSDRTSFFIFPEKNQKGVLHKILEQFAKNDLNLTKIESRPSKHKLGEYYFYVDFEGHIEDKASKTAISGLKSLATTQFLGSYPKAF